MTMNTKQHALYTHKQFADFHKVIITVTDRCDKMNKLVYVQYYFENGEHVIPEVGDNRNCSKTSFSTRKSIKASKNIRNNGKKNFHKVLTGAGGFEQARTKLVQTYL